MKKLILLSLLLLTVVSGYSMEKARQISVIEAVSYVQTTFYQGDDVDFYVSTDTLSDVAYWLIFVDEEPLKGWDHNCASYHIPTRLGAGKSLAYYKKEALNSPPIDKVFVPYQLQNRYGEHSSDKPHVAVPTLENGINLDAANHTYAVIISGGVAPIKNHERYWNDCSYIYQTLINKYCIPKNQVKVLMSDGLSPGSDMLLADGSGFASSPTDLDYDGIPDIDYSATKSNVAQCLQQLSSILTEDDQLFLYVIDHGTTLANGESAICLWKHESLSESELSTLLDNIDAGFMNIVMGQCKSGGFVTALAKPGRVIASACAADEYSYGCKDIPYDEFVYWWTKALNEKSPYSAGISDKNFNNGPMTMKYVFEYAQSHDRAGETPQYDSTPSSVGEDLSFESLPEKVSLYMKDYQDDQGAEPYEGIDYCNSPDVWVRLQNDGFENQEHQNPYITEPQQILHVYVKIRNRGTKPYMGRGKFCKIYWQQAGVSMTKKSWLGVKDRTQDQLYGGYVSRAEIRDTILSGESTVVHLLWPTEDMIYYLMQNENGRLHSCLLAKISDSLMNDSLELTPGQLTVAVNLKRNVVQKNLMIFGPEDLASLGTNGVSLNVRNTYDMERAYNLEFINLNSSNSIFEDADVCLKLSTGMKQAWEQGGYKAKYIMANNANVLSLNSFDSRLENLVLESLQLDKVDFICNFHANINDSAKYEFLVLLRDSITGNVIGGENFRIERGPTATLNGKIEYDSMSDCYKLVTDIAPDAYDCLWIEDRGNTITKEKVLKRANTPSRNLKVRMISKKDGSFVDLPVVLMDELRILNVACDGGNRLKITLSQPVMDDGVITICSADGMLNESITIGKGESVAEYIIPSCISNTVIVRLKNKYRIIDQQKIVLK